MQCDIGNSQLATRNQSRGTGNVAADKVPTCDRPALNGAEHFETGANDFIVNWIGGQDWTNALVWSGTAGFARSANTTYTVDGEVRGQ